MYLADLNLEHLLAVIEELNPQENQVIMIMAGEDHKDECAELVAGLQQTGVSFFGGFFTRIIVENENYSSGCIIKKFRALGKPQLIKGLDTTDFTIPAFPSDIAGDEKGTCMVMVDGLTGNIGAFLSELHSSWGGGMQFMGGGCGSLSLQQQPCVFSNEGIFQDAAVICPLNYSAKLGVQHGWEKLAGPIVATRTTKNIIHELNWGPAFDTYKAVLADDGIEHINSENFFDVSKGYPFGIYREDSEDVVRDPIAVTEDGSLVCVGEVPENTVLYVLKGHKQNLITAAKQAAAETISDDNTDIRHTLVIDCISRVLFLEDSFQEEVAIVSSGIQSVKKEVRPQGALSLGEIATFNEDLIEFFNKTIVVGSLYRR